MERWDLPSERETDQKSRRLMAAAIVLFAASMLLMVLECLWAFRYVQP